MLQHLWLPKIDDGISEHTASVWEEIQQQHEAASKLSINKNQMSFIPITLNFSSEVLRN